MKKTLVALASMAALGAFAQSSVTMYGIVEATVDIGYKASTNARLDTVSAAGVVTAGTQTINGTTKAGFRVQDGNDQGVGTSRIGWRGVEDLGGGLKANFLLEMGLRVDDGCVTTSSNAPAGSPGQCSSGNSGGNLFGRNAWVGASGGFGEVRLGRQVLGSFATQANGWSAGSSNGLYDSGSGTAPLMGGVRFSNAIRYITPNISGFTASAMLAAPESTVTTNNGLAGALNATTSAKPKVGFDLALDFANGPLYVGLGYNNTGRSNNSTLGGTTTVNGSADTKAYTLSAAYDLGIAKPYFNYTAQKTSGRGLAAGTTTSRTDTAKAYHFGVRAPIGAATLIAGLGNNKLTGSGSAVTGGVVNSTEADSGKITAFQIGMQYPLSKRTLIEANYGQNKNKLAARDNTFGGLLNAFTGAQIANVNTKINALNVGLRHTF